MLPTWHSVRQVSNLPHKSTAGASPAARYAGADEVLTNSVPIDVITWLGPGVQSSEVRRILKSGGVWVRDGSPYYTKP